jgi:hypothetical protein
MNICKALTAFMCCLLLGACSRDNRNDKPRQPAASATLAAGWRVIKALLLFLTFSCALLALVPPSSGYNIGNFIFLLLFVVFFWLTIRKKK